MSKLVDRSQYNTSFWESEWYLEVKCIICNDILWWDEDESFDWLHVNDNTPICRFVYNNPGTVEFDITGDFYWLPEKSNET